MRLLAILSSLAIIATPAAAAPFEVFNGDFQNGSSGPLALDGGINGSFEFGIDGFQSSTTNGIGVFQFTDNVYTSAPAAVGNQIAFIQSGATLSQALSGVTIEAGATYTLSALFGNRLDSAAGISGTFGFFAGDDPTNIIGSASIVDGGEGTFNLQDLALSITAGSAAIGETLGIFFTSAGGQLNLDAINLDILTSAVGANEVPLPAAAWLFGSVLMAGGFASRKRKKS